MFEILQFVFSTPLRFLGCSMFWLLTCVAVSSIKLVDIHIDYGDTKFADNEDDVI